MEDYHSMKRKELQALCKKHNIPAGSANSVLADKLSQLLNVQEKQKPTTRQRACLKSQVETTDEGEPEVSKREAKKVRFSPTNDLVEYEPGSAKKQQDVVRETGALSTSVAKKVGKPVVDNDSRVEVVDDAVQIPVKLTRSRAHILEKDDVIPNVGKRQGRSAVKDVNEEPKDNVGKATRSKVHGLGKCGAVQLDENTQSKRPVNGDETTSESVKEPVVVRARVTRSKAEALMDVDMDPDVNPQVKKKHGRQVAKAVQLAEPAKEVVDIPARTTRTRGHPLKEDIGNTVTKTQTEKKRTRREMKATDQISNSSNVALEDNQELPKRKLSRTRELKVDDEGQGDKVKKVDNKRVTVSRVTRGSKSKTENKVEAQRTSKRVQQIEEPLERAVKKNVKRREFAMQPVQIEAVHLEEPVNAPTGRVTRRKSIMQKAQGRGIDPEKTKVVLHLEEPVSGPAGEITRRKSLMQKVHSKATDKPLDGKSEPVKETDIPDSPKTVGRNQSKRQSGSLSTIGEGLKDKENSIRSGKDVFEDKTKAVSNSTISLKSKKRRTPIIEDGPVEAEYVSPVESRRSMRSASKSEGKAVAHQLPNSAKNQLKSGLKTRSPGGAVVGDGSSKKRAKLSVMKQSESEGHGEQSNIERTPISKLVSFELGESVIENEHAPAIDESHRRFTRSAIGSNRKEPRQSVIKEQPIGDVQLSSHNVPKFRHGSAVKTAPGRVTRSGIKHAGNVASGLSERLHKKKQQFESAHQRKPFDDLQMSSHEVAESRLIPDVTIGAQSEILKEVTDQILERVDDISVSESARLPAEGGKESKSEIAITMESLSSLFDVEASGVESSINLEFVTTPGTRSNVQTSSEAVLDAISDESNIPNQVAYGKSAIFSEAEVQVALNAADSVLKSGRLDAYEKGLENLGSMSKGLQSDVGAEQPVVSVCMTVGMEESADLFGDADFTRDSVPYRQAFEQPGIESKSEGEEDTEKAEECERGSAQKQVMQEPVSEDDNLNGNIEKLQSSDMGYREVFDGELDKNVDFTRDSVPYSQAFEQPDVKSKSEGEEDTEKAEGERGSAQKQVMQGPVSEDDNLNGKSEGEKHTEKAEEGERGSAQKQVMQEPVFEDENLNGKPEGEEDTEKAEEGKRGSAQKQVMQEPVSEDDNLNGISEGEEDTENAEEGERGSAQKQVMHEPVSEDDNLNGTIERLQSSDMGNREFSEGELDGKTNKDVNFLCDPVPYSQAFEQPGIKSEEGGERGSAQKQVMQEPVSEDDNGNFEKLQSSDMGNREVSERELDGDTNKDDTIVQLTVGDELVGLSVDDDDTKDDIVTAHDNLAKQNELSMGKDISFGLGMDMYGVASDLVDTVKDPTQGLELEAVASTIDVCEVPILGESDGVGGFIPSHGEDHVPSGVEGEDEADNANSKHESYPKSLTDDNVCDTSTLGIDDEFNTNRLSVPMTDPSSANAIHETPPSRKDSSFGLATERHGVEDNLVDAGKEPECEVAPSTANDVHKMPSLGEPDGVDGGVNATRESDDENLVLSGEDGGDDADNTFKEHEFDSKLLINDGVSDTSVLAKDDYDNITRLFEPTLEPSSANDIVETPISGDDRSVVADTGKEHVQEHEFELAPSAGNDVQEMPILAESDSANATKERETDSVPSTGCNMPSDGGHGFELAQELAMDRNVADAGKEHEFELAPSAGNDVQEMPSLGESGGANDTKECETDSVPSTGCNMPSDGEQLVLSGGDGEDRAYNTSKEHESKLKRLTDDDVSDTSVAGKEDDYNLTRLCEPTSDPSTNDIVETPFSVNDIFGESDNAMYDQKSPLKPIIDDDDDVDDGVNNGPRELESGLEPSVTNYSPNVPVLGNNAGRNRQDGEPEHEQSARIDMFSMDEQFVGGVGSEPDQNENMPVVTEDLIGSTMAVDACEESLQDIDKDAVSDFFGDIYGLENAIGVSDTENDSWSEQKVTRTSEPDESAFSTGSDTIYPDMNIEQITEEAELTTESDHVLSDKEEQLGTTIEQNLDSGKSMEDCPNSAVEMLDSRLVGNIKVEETPTREEIPVGGTLSDASTFLKEDIRHKQEKTQKENTFMDWENYSFRMVGFQKSVSANENDDLLAKSTKDDLVLDFQSSARASSSIQESSSLAAEFENSLNKLEHSSRNVTDRESDQHVDLLKGNANMLEDFNWSDSPLKSLFTTPAASRISHVKGGREHASGFSASAHYFDHGNNDFDGENTRGNGTGQENEMCGVPDFEHFPSKYYEDEEEDGSMAWLGKNDHIEFKGDQYVLSSESTRTGNRHESSGLNVNSTSSDVLGEKETQLKGSETGDDLAFNKGKGEI